MKIGSRRWGWGAAAVTMLTLLLVPWWRNHALLRDFYDYGHVIAGVGLIEGGERPYVDFLTPIQTLQYYVGVLAEKIWGARYLSLTYAAAGFIAGTFLGFVALLVRPFGGWAAMMIAAAVVAASGLQHTIPWYNAMGVAWLTVAFWGTAAGGERRGKWTGVVLVATALWLGGMTKLTYQIAATALVLAWVLRAAERGKVTGRAAAASIVGVVVFATVVPIATEMMLTGASFAQWKQNVLELAQARTELLEAIGTWKFYWQTPHDYHPPVYLRAMGAWGVGLLLAVTAIAAVGIWIQRERRGRELMWLAIMSGGAVACGLVFLALHYEIAHLAGAAWLVLATGIVLACVPREAVRCWAWARGVLVVGAVTLLVPAWASAWAGARAIWGHGDVARSEMKSADDLPERFAYLRGMKIEPGLHEGLRQLEAFRSRRIADGAKEENFRFVHGTEWLARTMPASGSNGMPLWIQEGTTFSAREKRAMIRELARGGQWEVIVADRAWNHWPEDFHRVLDRRYEDGVIGGSLVAYWLPGREAAPFSRPVEWARRANSNLYGRAMDVEEGRIEWLQRPGGAWFAGSWDSARVALGFGLYRLSGDFVAELPPDAERGEARFRVRRANGPEAGALMWDEAVTVTRESPSATRPFSISPGGGRVALEVELPKGQVMVGGWRTLRTEHTAGNALPGGPLQRGLKEWELNERGVFFGKEAPVAEERDGQRGWRVNVGEELWVRVGSGAGRVRGGYRLEGAGSIRVSVVYVHGGRFDLFYDRAVEAEELRPEVSGAFDVPTPERDGWVVLTASGSEGRKQISGRIWWSEPVVQ